MKIKNYTRYRTIELKKQIRLVMAKVGINPDRYVVVIEYRRGFLRGQGMYHGKWIRILMQRKKQPLNEFCYVVEHELHHNLNVRHKDMDIDSMWKHWKSLEGFFEEKPIPVKPKRDFVAERHQKAIKKVKEWQTKLKRTKTMLKKWERKLKYYEQKNRKI